jgi:hypothetical protein
MSSKIKTRYHATNLNSRLIELSSFNLAETIIEKLKKIQPTRIHKTTLIINAAQVIEFMKFPIAQK